MTATVTHTVRRPFGLHRDIYIIRCWNATCRWHTETSDRYTAYAISRNHECEGDRP
jgi:hypothetical protein